MNSPADDNLASKMMPDVQGMADIRQIAINKVGIKSIRHPMLIKDKSPHAQHTIALFSMYVHLPHDAKGTHMSRFVEILNRHNHEVSVQSFENILRDMVKKLDAQSGYVEMSFPYFINKAAPLSGVQSLLDYDVTFIGAIENGQYRFTLKVVVPVTSLCPCSKEISERGAHNQRSHITLTINASQPVWIKEPVWIEELVRFAEDEASCELYGMLKRADEKYVTERAYDNPKFVEDVARDVAAALNRDARIESYIVEAENFESIHNHSAYARIERDNSH